MRQVIKLEGATGAALVHPYELQGRVGFVVLRLILGERSFQVLQRERQLIVANAFGLAAEVRAADLCQNVLELRVANRELIALGKCCIACRHWSATNASVGNPPICWRSPSAGRM